MIAVLIKCTVLLINSLCIVEVILELMKYVCEQYNFVNSPGFGSHRIFVMIHTAFHIC
jgi:hypothetical protein